MGDEASEVGGGGGFGWPKVDEECDFRLATDGIWMNTDLFSKMQGGACALLSRLLMGSGLVFADV